MSPTTLALTILGAAATSTGIGIAVVNLTNKNNESIEEKIEKLWEEIKENVNYLNTKISEIQKNQNLTTKYTPILAKIFEIAETKDNKLVLKLPKNTEESYQQLQNINEELQEIIKSLN